MKVQVKVLINSDEINEAKNKNAYYAKLREENKMKKHSKDRLLVPDDVEVPEQKIELSDVLLDSKDILRARVNEIGMISIVHLGQEMQIVHSDEVWTQLEERFKENLAFPKLNDN